MNQQIMHDTTLNDHNARRVLRNKDSISESDGNRSHGLNYLKT